MIRITLVILSCIVISTFSYSQDYQDLMNSSEVRVSDIIEQIEAYLSENPSQRERKFFERWKYNAQRLKNAEGYLPDQKKLSIELKKFLKEKNHIKSKRTPIGNWEELGPANWTATEGYSPGVGRLTAMAFNPSNTSVLIVGSDTGGIWKTTDQGNNWAPLLDNYTNMDVFSLAMDPSIADTYFWGSSEGRIYKSTDAGASWNIISTITDGSSINKIIIHPSNSSKIFASDEDNGIFRSDDAGVTWSSVISENAGYDVEFKPNNPNTIYASGESFYKSNDGGITWSEVSEFDDTGAKMIGVSPNDPNRVYVVEANNNSFNAIYVSFDSGVNFTKRSHPNQNYFGYETDASDMDGQAPRDMGIAVSPTDADEVHIAGINTWRSTNAGVTFNPTSEWTYPNINYGYCHADVDDLMFLGSKLVALSDGGIFFANDPSAIVGSNFFTDMTSGMGIHQFYKIGISQTNNVIITGGAQDNGSSTYNGTSWNNWCGADGMEGFVDKNNTNILYGTQQNGTLVISTDGGLTYDQLNQPTMDDGNWVTPFEQDPQDANTIYSGFTRVYKSNDSGENWSSISQDFGVNLDHLKIAPSNNNIIFAAAGGDLYKTTTGTGTWTLLTGYEGDISSIAIHPSDPNKVALATTGDDKVYISNDGGNTWNGLNNGLPDFSALAVVWQDNPTNGLYLGMNFGIFYTEDGLSGWQNFSNQLPNVMINELEINTAESKIYAATYGRGVWRSDLYSSVVLPVQLSDFDIELRNKKVKISWSTASEVNHDYFEIERSSNGLDWEILESNISNNSSNSHYDYEFWDNNPYFGLNYYRVIDVDLTGKRNYSDVKSINLSGVNLTKIFPNPNSGIFNLTLDSNHQADVEILLYNTIGKLIKAKTIRVDKGYNQTLVDLCGHTGVFYMTVTVDGKDIYNRKKILVIE